MKLLCCFYWLLLSAVILYNTCLHYVCVRVKQDYCSYVEEDDVAV